MSLSQRKWWIAGGAILAVSLAVHASVQAWLHGPAPTAVKRGAAISVRVAAASRSDMPLVLDALGTVTPLYSVNVKTQISGTLTQVAFKEGQLLHAGDFLAQIDPRPYQLAESQAHGQLLKDQALLKAAQNDLTRYRTLFEQDSIAKQQLDTQEALVQQYQGAVETDEALVNVARLNITYCHIVSPITGRVGLRLVDPGNYVQPGDSSGVAVVTQLQPITVIFTLPEDSLVQVMQRLHSGAQLPVTLFNRADTQQLAQGTLDTVDNQIDTTTGTVRLRASFANDDGTLCPNQFVNARLLVDQLRGATVVPSAAILHGAPGSYVYRVKDDKTVAVQPVKLGAQADEHVAILEGLKPDDTVVIDGLDRLRDGASVTFSAKADPATTGVARAAQ
jgi:membrane fusion protein, multidrug efflux system